MTSIPYVPVGPRLIDGSVINQLIDEVTGESTGTYTGTFNGVVGGVTPAAGTFTTLHGTTVNGTTIDGPIGSVTPAAGIFTNLTASGVTKRSVTNAITAHAGGGQGSATALTADINSITVCATAADSVVLPAATAGRMVQVSNLGAAYASIFPASGEIIDALAADTSISLAVRSSIIFTCAVAGSWKATPQPHAGAKYTTGTTTTTFAAGQLTGAYFVVYNNTQGTPGSIITRTAAEMFIDDPFARVGGTYHLRVINNQGTGVLTITAGSNVTLTGTMTIATNTYRDFIVTYTSATALVIQQCGIGTDA